MHVSLDTIADAIPLTAAERARFAELEGIVQTNLQTFLTTGRALAEIRNRRLYREEHESWESYCTRKWGFGYGHANDLIRSTEVAEGLLASCAGSGGDAPLPPDLSPDVLRPLQRLDPPLQSACWRLASRVSEHPSRHIVARIARVVQAAISEGNGGTSQPKPKLPQSEKKLFLLSVHRLSDGPYFSAQLVVAGLSEADARKHRAACGALISRLHEVLEQIRESFPQL
jgi:hypothetical protein